MIIWFNCKISDIRPNPQPRFHLRNDNRFDIARYSFASYAPLIPLVSKFIFNLEMADGHAGQEAEMETWLRSIFPEDKLILNWYRCNNLAQWREIQKVMDDIGDSIVYPAGNEDHIFVDSNIDLMTKGLELIKQHQNPSTVIGVSHYPEGIRVAHYYNKNQTPELGYVSLSSGNNDAIRIMKREFFDWYLDKVTNPDMFIFRTEQWNSITLPTNNILVATKEQFRHFDGYAHVGIGPDIAPPLEIPPGFFEKNITIRYGYTDRKADCVNLNPTSETLYAEDGLGADYRWCMDDIPAFWKPYISHVDVAPNVNEQEMVEARDRNLVLMSRIHFNWPHMGVVFDEHNYPPVEWLNPHMKALTFTN